MSRLFGRVTQNGYVVQNLEQSLTYWTDVLCVGPFYVFPPMTFDHYRYKGVESAPEIRIALANSGRLQIELIEQINAAPSFYKAFIDGNGPGLQHMSVWSTSYDEDIRRIRDHGVAPIVDCKIHGGPRASFYGSDGMTGAVMEVLDLGAETKAIFDMIREAAEDWDGKHGIRHL